MVKINSSYSKSYCIAKMQDTIDELSNLKTRIDNHYSNMDLSNTKNQDEIKEYVSNIRTTINTWIENLEGSILSLRE